MILCTLTIVAQEKPTLFLIGDSTMSDKKDPEENPEHGWGQMLPELMSSNINIDNHAVNGRSTRNFIAEGRWEKVKEQLKPGDFVFIQFGHNDQKVNDPERYTNPFTAYRYNLEKFVKETRDKGATPVLFSFIVRRNFNENGVLVDTHGEYPLVTRMVAKDLNVPFIDMQWLTERLETGYGPVKSKQLHLHLEPGEDPYEPEGIQDDTHLSKKGATLVAGLALQEIARQDLELKKYVEQEVLEQEILDGRFYSHQNSSAQNIGQVSWRKAQNQDKQWYASQEAQRIADNVLLYQHNNGGWKKNIDMAVPLSEAEKEDLREEKSDKIGTSIDNGATFRQLRYLAKVYHATKKEEYKKAFLKGLDFLFGAQYESGGWPQFYPLKKGYYEHITFNDGAMIGVMELLREVALEEEPYKFVDQNRKEKAQRSIEKGLEVILSTQVKVDGEPTVWSAQHDKDDYSPAKARAYELPSLSGKESAGIVEYLMEIENPSERVKTAIRSAVKWFEEKKVMGQKIVWIEDADAPEGKDRIMVKDPTGGPLWGRFNEIETGRPIFVGRDGKIKYHLNEIERERRVNYNYIDNYAEDLLKENYPEWEQKHTSQK